MNAKPGPAAHESALPSCEPSSAAAQEAGAGSRGGWRRLAAGARFPAAMFAVYLGLALLFFAGAWRDPAHLAPGGGSDPVQTMWFLSWAANAAAHGLDPFFTRLIDYPQGVNLMWNPSVLLAGGILAPLTLSAGAVFAYDTMLTLALAVSAFCAFCLALRLTGSRLGAAVAGLLYGFSPFAIAEAPSHAFLAFMWAPPLVLLFGYELASSEMRSPVLPGLALGTVLACQLLLSEEILALTVLLGALGLVAVRYLRGGLRGLRLSHAAKGLAAAAVPVAVFDFFPLRAQFFAPQRVTEAVHGFNFYVSDLTSFVVPTSSFAVAPWWLTTVSDRFTGNVTEWTSYLGLPLTLLTGLLVVRYWRRNLLGRWVGFMTVLVALLSLGPLLHVVGRTLPVPLPWILLQFLPLLSDVLPARMALFTDLGVALLLALFLAEGGSGRTKRALMVGVALLPLLPAWPLPAYSRSAPTFFTSGAVKRVIPKGSVVLVAPLATGSGLKGSPAVGQEADAMAWQAACGMCFKMPEGYALVPGSGGVQFGPPQTRLETDMISIANGEAVALPAGAERLSILAHLESERVTAIIVGPMSGEGAMVRYMTQLAGTPQGQDGSVYWWDLT